MMCLHLRCGTQAQDPERSLFQDRTLHRQSLQNWWHETLSHKEQRESAPYPPSNLPKKHTFDAFDVLVRVPTCDENAKQLHGPNRVLTKCPIDTKDVPGDKGHHYLRQSRQNPGQYKHPWGRCPRNCCKPSTLSSWQTSHPVDSASSSGRHIMRIVRTVPCNMSRSRARLRSTQRH